MTNGDSRSCINILVARATLHTSVHYGNEFIKYEFVCLCVPSVLVQNSHNYELPYLYFTISLQVNILYRMECSTA